MQALESVFMAVLQLFGMFSPKRLENGDIVDYFHTGEMGILYKTIVWLGFALLTIGLG
ncbi:hypothetical protein IV39_GL002135 [Lactiplantibacillus plantarum]|nr:hypothetical protein IV39_GL002135 [Lactiplantibacillus plantarum]